MESEAEDSFRTLVGVRASMLIETDIGTVIPQIRARWEHEYLDAGAQVNFTSAAAPNIAAFNVQGVKVARDSALIGTGISLFQHQGLVLQLDYDLRINADQVENLLSAGVSYAF